MAEERNFRSHYYEKMGFKSTDEKKLVEMLLKEEPINIDKLKQFCLRFPIPAMHRIFVWKILLGVLPPSHDCHKFVMTQRCEQYDNLEHVLKIMRKINTKSPESHVILKMYLIEESAMTFGDDTLDPDNATFLKMADCICSFIDDPIDSFWIMASFYRSFLALHEDLATLPQKTEFYLKKDEQGRRLITHLETHGIWSCVPLTEWFKCAFAGVLPYTSLQRIWDKIIGGSPAILAFVAVTILVTLHRPLLSMSTRDEVLKYLEKIPEDTCDLIVTNAIDLWQKHGYHQISFKSDSPSLIDR